jgi:hypothetical protein
LLPGPAHSIGITSLLLALALPCPDVAGESGLAQWAHGSIVVPSISHCGRAAIRTPTFNDLPGGEQTEFLVICAVAKLVPEEFNVSFADEIVGDVDVEPQLRSVFFSLARSRAHMLAAAKYLGPCNSRKTFR